MILGKAIIWFLLILGILYMMGQFPSVAVAVVSISLTSIFVIFKDS